MDAPDTAPKADPRAQRASPAFTLLEVLIALTILSLAAVGAGLAAPAWLGRAELERTAAAFDRSALAARTAALATGRPMVLAFDADTRRLAVGDAAATGASRDAASLDAAGLGPASAAPVFTGSTVSAASTVAVRDLAVAGGATFTVPKNVGFSLTGVSGAPGAGLFGGASAGPLATTSGRAAIVFLPDGTSTGGLVTLTEGDRRLSRRVAWLTGKVGPGE